MQTRTIYNLNDIVGKTISEVKCYKGMIAIHFEEGLPLLLTATNDRRVVWQDVLCGFESQHAIEELKLYIKKKGA